MLDDYSNKFNKNNDFFVDSIAILKKDGQTFDCYMDNWEKTFEHRQQRILLYETVNELMSVWPIIGKPIGPFLVCNSIPLGF